MPNIYNLPKDYFKFEQRFARWADKQGWFKLDDNFYLLPDGSEIYIIQSDNYIIIEKDGKIKTTIKGYKC